MRQFKSIVVGGLLAIVSQVSASGTWQAWPTVGEATLKWGPWVIYDSQLRSPSGRYDAQVSEAQTSLALVIRYRRDIDKDDLLEATDEQWQKLGFSSGKRQRWLRQLAGIWPDVRKGDRLIFVTHAEGGTFYRDNRVIGEVADEEMAKAFISIWLSPRTEYPDLRRRLIGDV
ncbi:chalcone isomerase family protein [Photobacterium sp. 1_MG-2023]|uniref:chalcone isomerase family protein n=1 Tax=Photobacterium sp. 1_MG-2023 TaxID=3062646 RepID=UPI0026E18031|nr:chalcone isomerase family protein [Photobacterium sp. 1_MG-2023]MDO6706973.1 chalcone isomerase family protein [Photobacterium sp. 1_MG-2023]